MTYASYYMVVSWLLKMGGLKIISINEMTNGFWPPAFSDKKHIRVSLLVCIEWILETP